jgi:hypothetical protein
MNKNLQFEAIGGKSEGTSSDQINADFPCGNSQLAKKAKSRFTNMRTEEILAQSTHDLSKK